MKKNEFKGMVRKIVREEVAMAIQEVITELKQPMQQVSKPKPKKKTVEKKQYTKNSILNEVMNETAASEEWKTVGDGTYTSDRVDEVMKSSYGDLMNNNTNSELPSSLEVDSKNAPDFLTKDYRKLMKAVDKKQGKV